MLFIQHVISQPLAAPSQVKGQAIRDDEIGSNERKRHFDLVGG